MGDADMNKHRTRTLRRLLRTDPRRVNLQPDGARRARAVWAVALPTEDPEMVEIHSGDTRNEALRAAYEARGAIR